MKGEVPAAQAVGFSACRPSIRSADSENLGTPVYGSPIRRRNRRQQVGAGTACRTPQSPVATAPLSGEPCGRATMPPLKGEAPAAQAVGLNHEDLGRFNLWRATVVNKTRGNRWRQCRPSIRSADSENLGTLVYGSPIRRRNRRQQVGAGSACRQQVSVGTADWQQVEAMPTINPQRGFGEFGNSGLWFPNSSIEPAEAGGTGHCPAG